ncbi:MAG TPA: hypothetical protein VMB71_00465, partial [Acetobacteraceae bacterium]|nr:hypothetical protein [Acetobacteraceae bacterium]
MVAGEEKKGDQFKKGRGAPADCSNHHFIRRKKMPADPTTASVPYAPIPADDRNRQLTVIGPDDASARHIALAGGIYTILVSGEQTA